MLTVGPGCGRGARRLALAGVAMLCGVSIASAGVIPVDTTADDTVVNGNCTLREAVIAANTDTAVDACAADRDRRHRPVGRHVRADRGQRRRGRRRDR